MSLFFVGEIGMFKWRSRFKPRLSPGANVINKL